MDNMEGRMTEAAHAQLVQSAVDGGMNMLRVWGGGIFLPTAFYDTADRLGLLIFQDQMFTTTTKTHEPHGTPEEETEVRQNVRRLAHHPSIAVW